MPAAPAVVANGFVLGYARCAACQHRQYSAWPKNLRGYTLECEVCHYHACVPEDSDWWKRPEREAG